jgi:hypothetical protein
MRSNPLTLRGTLALAALFAVVFSVTMLTTTLLMDARSDAAGIAPVHPYRTHGGYFNDYFEHDVYVDGVLDVNGYDADGGSTVTVNGSMSVGQGPNFGGNAGGSANHIVATCPAEVGQGTQICVVLAAPLGTGTNTVTCNPLPDGGPPSATLPLKSHFNPANNIATAYSTASVWCGTDDGTEWQDRSE